MWILYRKDALSFISGIQNVYLVEVSNRHYRNYLYPLASPLA